MKYKGIIFDFNGVILWDSEWHVEAWSEVTEEVLGKPLSREQIEKIHGRTVSEIFRDLLGPSASEQEIEECGKRKEQLYRQIAVSKGDLFSLSRGCKQLFSLLKKNNIPSTIATASGPENLKLFTDHLHLNKWFDVDKIVYDDGNLPGKPSPVMYLRAAEKLQLPPIDCIVVEDSIMGLASARNAKVGKIIALGPKNEHEKLKQTEGVGKVITQLNEISLSDFER